MKKESINSGDFSSMRCREITLADGRYMIFYTFDESLSSASVVKEKEFQPKPVLKAAEEKNV
ncbi:MAG: hypothetical protein WA584_20400 [Pyrinomonadaceae bacterium]